jgi:hypothetical protein
MTPEMETAAWEGLAGNHAAQIHAEGNATVARWLAAHDQVAVNRERMTELERITAQVSEELDAERDRVANLDRLLQERDRLIEAACPCLPGAPRHEHLTGGYAIDWTDPATVRAAGRDKDLP